MNTGKVVVGVLAGVAIGALLGVLFAPDKGSETRKKIAKKSSDGLDELNDRFDDLLESMAEKFGLAKEEVMNLVENGKYNGEELKKQKLQ